jgi:hypothetical protein
LGETVNISANTNCDLLFVRRLFVTRHAPRTLGSFGPDFAVRQGKTPAMPHSHQNNAQPILSTILFALIAGIASTKPVQKGGDHVL